MERLKVIVGAVLAATLAAGGAFASDFTPAIVWDVGGKSDKSFNQAAYDGAERFKAESGIAYRGYEVVDAARRDRTVHDAAAEGAQVVVATGFSMAGAVEAAARKFPKTRFTLIDAVVDLPNVQSVLFKEHEGSFLVGMAAAMGSRSGKIGFVGGMDVPLIRRFALGYEEGAKYVRPDVVVYQDMTGTTSAAWTNPARGAELARAQFERGADVVYAAAGATGLGVLRAARDAGKLAIGVDSNQNHLHPGTMLTSMIKRVDVAVYQAFKSAREGTWQGGVRVLGLAEGGVGWALDRHNRSLVSPDMEEAIDNARKAIIVGAVRVTDYMARQ